MIAIEIAIEPPVPPIPSGLTLGSGGLGQAPATQEALKLSLILILILILILPMKAQRCSWSYRPSKKWRVHELELVHERASPSDTDAILIAILIEIAIETPTQPHPSLRLKIIEITLAQFHGNPIP